MGGASRREILSIKPETFFCAVFETAVKKTSLVRFASDTKGDTPVEGCQGAHSYFLATLQGVSARYSSICRLADAKGSSVAGIGRLILDEDILGLGYGLRTPGRGES
jgi:hypothetical protein